MTWDPLESFWAVALFIIYSAALLGIGWWLRGIEDDCRRRK